MNGRAVTYPLPSAQTTGVQVAYLEARIEAGTFDQSRLMLRCDDIMEIRSARTQILKGPTWQRRTRRLQLEKLASVPCPNFNKVERIASTGQQLQHSEWQKAEDPTSGKYLSRFATLVKGY